jgi:hypothetical protein
MATTYSFNSVNFNILLGGAGHSAASEVTITHIPGGANVIDVSGNLENRYSYNIRLADVSAYNSLAASRDATHTLNCPDGATLTAVLVSIERRDILHDNSVLAQANFIVA